MIYTELTSKAAKLMFEKHREQTDKSGLPYVFHPWHVAESMTNEYETCAALLHDVLEDTDTTAEDLLKEGFPQEVVDALVLLKHDEGLSYDEYIKRMAGNPICRAVKLSDLRHNADLTRLAAVTEKDLRRREKYLKYIDFLTGKEDCGG
ncbi:MAG: GTP pyrophosphokinase [Solobacterium sp.]|nr:GTP pyrophosphokinase [Solobacterium sp.]